MLPGVTQINNITLNASQKIYVVYKPVRFTEELSDLILTCDFRHFPTDQQNIEFVTTNQDAAYDMARDLMVKAVQNFVLRTGLTDTVAAQA